MRELTFLTFLKIYLKDISGRCTLSIHRLCLDLKNNYRILDPLILYSCLIGKQSIFNKYTKNKYLEVVNRLNKTNFLDDSFRDFDFQKIWETYQVRIMKAEWLRSFKNEIRKNTLSNLERNKITKYRVYTDLKLNPGNVNAYLTNGNCDKVSLKVAKEIYNYSLKSN